MKFTPIKCPMGTEQREMAMAFKSKYRLGSNIEVVVYNTYIHVIRKRHVAMLAFTHPFKSYPTSVKNRRSMPTKPLYLPFKEGVRDVLVEDD